MIHQKMLQQHGLARANAARSALAATLVVSIAGAASAQPELLRAPSIDISVRDADFRTLQALNLYEARDVGLGEAARLDPLDPSWAAPVDVAFSSMTIGDQRTLTLSYATPDGSNMLLEPLFDALRPRSAGDFYFVGFGVWFADAQHAGSIINDRWTFLDGDEVLIDSIGQRAAFARSLALGSSRGGNPAMPEFWERDGGVLDRIVYQATYTIPAPGSGAVVLAVAMLAGRRR